MKNILLLLGFFILLVNPACEQNGWISVYTKDGITVYHREVKGEELKEFKGEVVVNASLSGLIALISDIDNFAEWGYQVRSAEMLRNEGNVNYIHVVTKAQWPVWDRDIVYRCQMSQNQKNLEVNIEMTGKPDYIPPKKDIVRMPDAYGLFVLTPIDKNHVKVVFQLRANPGGQIPLWMSNAVANDSPFVTLNNLRKEIQKEKYRNAVTEGIIEYGSNPIP